MIFLRAYSHVLVQKSGAIQNPTDINAVNESGVKLSNEVGKLLVGARLVNGVIQNHLSRRVEHPTADAIMPLDMLEQGEVGHLFWFAETLSFRVGRKQTVLLSQIDMI